MNSPSPHEDFAICILARAAAAVCPHGGHDRWNVLTPSNQQRNRPPIPPADFQMFCVVPPVLANQPTPGLGRGCCLAIFVLQFVCPRSSAKCPAPCCHPSV